MPLSRRRQITIIVSLLGLVTGCKLISGSDANRNDQPREEVTPPPLKQGADKESESVGGIPGYKMQCQFALIPTSLDQETTLACQLDGVDPGTTIDWIIDRPDQQSGDPSTLPADEPFQFTIAAETRIMSLDLTTRTLITGTIDGSESLNELGRELLAAPADSYRVDSRCDELFALMLTDAQTQFFYLEMNAFAGCQQLSEKLEYQILPASPEVATIPPATADIQASCDDANGQFTLTVAKPTFQGNAQLGPLPQAICHRLVNLIHKTDGETGG
jgi:hypothetical protein